MCKAFVNVVIDVSEALLFKKWILAIVWLN